MSSIKKTTAVAGLILAAAICIVSYASFSLTSKAQAPTLEPEAKLKALSSAAKLFPWNEKGYETAGLTLLTRAAENIADVGPAGEDLRGASSNFRRALRLNPGSAAGHFYYAKTLDLMRYFAPAERESPFREYQKAARLAGPDRNLIREIGIILLGRWASLSAGERDFTQDLLKQSLLAGDEKRFQEVLHVWDLDIRDDEVIQRIVPESPLLLRMYAQFLAEKNMSLAARHKTLARAERLEYEQAWKTYQSMRNETNAGRAVPIAQRLRTSLALLDRIKFFGYLAGQENIGAEVVKKTELYRTVALDLAKVKLEENRDLTQADEAFRAYLALENDFNRVTELETYLKELRIIPENDADLPVKDIRTLSFNVLLMFKLHKYRQIISIGTQLQRSLLPTDPAVKKYLSEIFQMVGDSYFKLDFVYEPEGFFEKALELSPGNPEILIRMKKYYERRNETEKIGEIDRRLEKVLSTGALLGQPRPLAKGSSFDQTLFMTSGQKRVRIELRFDVLPGNPKPLVSVYLNDRVFWEDYLQGPDLAMELEVEEGFNRLQIAAVNGPVTLAKVSVAALTAEPFSSQGRISY